jgi:hypothetical protein
MPTDVAREKVRKRIREDTPYWAEHFAKIIDKKRKMVPLVPSAGQLEFDRLVEAQRAEGKPMRVIALKARQVGISTWTQAKLVQRATLWENYSTMTVAQDRKTGPKLYRMAEIMYRNLPDDKELAVKPPIGQHSSGSKLHFGDRSTGVWEAGTAFPNSTYEVDTAKEGNAGRGATPQGVHCSELAFWDQMETKLIALLNGVPDEPETFVCLESTANGHNEFKEWWDKAWSGESEWTAFFWPWWKQEEYRLDFVSEAEKEDFRIGEGQYGQEEPDLVEQFDLSLEQLNWRRSKIASLGGDLRNFHQEYPATPEQAFLSTGQRVFDPYRVSLMKREAEQQDPPETSPDNPGPVWGEFEVASTVREERERGEVDVPNEALWVPRDGGAKVQPWRLWLPEDQFEAREGEFIIGVDVSGGMMESTDEPDYQAIQVVNHKTREQVAEYRSRVEPDILAEQVLLAALWFNNAWVAIERTGGWGLPVIRKLFREYQYPFLYRSKRFGSTNEKTEKKLGWDTTIRTKPDLIAGMQAHIREDDLGGVKSRLLASEFDTYMRAENGSTGAAPKCYDDLLMAYMIAQFVASERPLMNDDDPQAPRTAFRASSSGMSAYDPRYG